MKERYVNNKLVLDPEYPTPATPAVLATTGSKRKRSQHDPAQRSPRSGSEESETRKTPIHSDRSLSQILTSEDSERRKAIGDTDRSSHTLVSDEPCNSSGHSSRILCSEDSDRRKVPGNIDRSSLTFFEEFDSLSDHSSQSSDSWKWGHRKLLDTLDHCSGSLGRKKKPSLSDQFIHNAPLMAEADDETRPQFRTVARKGERQGDIIIEDDGWDLVGADPHRTGEELLDEPMDEDLEDGIIITVWNMLRALLGTEIGTKRGTEIGTRRA